MQHISYNIFPLDLDAAIRNNDLKAMATVIEMTRENYFSEEFTLIDLGITTRVFNHWTKMGLMPDRKKWKSGNTYRFNFIELIWFKIVKELREFGYPIEKIKHVKQQLLSEISYGFMFDELEKLGTKEIEKHLKKQKLKNHTEEQFVKTITDGIKQKNKFKDEFIYFLQFQIMDCIFNKNDVRILIDIEGNIIPYSDTNNEVDELIEKNNFDKDSFISISLIKFLKQFIINKKNTQFISKNMILNDNELYILSLIRDGKAKSLTIKFENQKPSIIEK